MRTATLGAAVVGLGVGEAHAKALAGDARCRLRVVVDNDAQKAAAVARALKARAAPSFEGVLDDPSIQVVVLASYDQDHYSQALAALKAGKHVFVEKPLCRTKNELEQLAKARAKAGAHLASNLVLRAAPLYRHVRQLVESGRMGTLYAFDGDYLYGRIEKITAGWRRDVADYSVMQGGGIHLVDLMLWLTGERPQSAAASGSRLVTKGTAFRYDDFHAAEFRFPSGLVGRVTANFGCVHRHQHVVRLFGTKATFLFDDAGARLHESRDPKAAPSRLPQAPEPPAKGALIPDFIAAVASGADPAPAARREFDAVAACLAADAAKGTDRRVKVEYPS